MCANNPLSSLEHLSKPLIKLLDIVENAGGALWEPYGIRRKAKAEADAMLILANAEIKSTDIQYRAAKRIATQELRRQRNIESIVNKTVLVLPEDVSDEPVDQDWTSRFFSECQDVSNGDLQDIWARLLAAEVTNPNTCSRRTMSILQQMSAADAKFFQHFCSYTCRHEGSLYVIYGWNDPYKRNLTLLERHELSLSDILQAEALGLCRFDSETGFPFKEDDIIYFDNRRYKLNNDDDRLRQYSDVIRFSIAGTELGSIINTQPNRQYFQDVIQHARSCGVDLVGCVNS